MEADTSNETTIAVVGPAVPIVPSVVFQAPLSVSICVALEVDAYLSSGSAGRDFVAVDWTVVESPMLNRTTTSSEVFEALEMPPATASAQGNEVLVYSTETLTALFEEGVRALHVSLALENVFGEKGNSSTRIILSSDSRPTVKIVGGTEGKSVLRPDALSVKADATATVCGNAYESASQRLDYEWSLAFYDDGGSSTGIESTSRDPRFFTLDSYTLDAATDYLLSVRVSDELTGNFSSESVRVSCGLSDLEVVISGGSRSVPQRGIEIISAAASEDPDVQGVTGAAAGLAFEWNCTNLDDHEDTSCITAVVGNTTHEELVLDLSLLGYRVFRVAVSVTRRQESSLSETAASTSIQLYHDTDPPSVGIDVATSVVLANERLVLTGTALAHISGETATAVLWLNTTWSVVQGAFVGEASLLDVSRSSLQADSTSWFKAGDATSTCDWVAQLVSRCDVVGQDGTLARDACLFSCTNGCLYMKSEVNLVVQRHTLIEGASYTFELDAALTDASDTGFATVAFYVARSPRGGDVVSSPTRGQALNTTFTISAFDWEGDELPLLYGFGIEGGQVLRVSTEDAVLRDILLPPGEDECEECSQTVVATIQDAIGASTEDSVEVVVTPNTQRGSALLTQVDGLLSSALAAHSYEDVCNIAIASA
ncbi:hypothetical protein CTAYLR_004950, partial [Chrysophaeum taylorii]